MELDELREGRGRVCGMGVVAGAGGGVCGEWGRCGWVEGVNVHGVQENLKKTLFNHHHASKKHY